MKRRNILLRVLTTVAAVMMSAMSASAQVNAEQVLNIGRNVMSMEDYMLAIQYFNLAIKAKPYLSDPYFYRGLAKLQLEDYKGAEEDCTLAIERNKYKTEAYKLRGFARQILGKDSLAIEDYDYGLEYNPLDKYFLFYKAVAHTTLKQYEPADSTFGILLKAYPSFEDGYVARAGMYLQKNDTVASMADVDKALGLSKNLINAYLLRADVNASRKNWEAASADMDEALRLQPQESDLYVNRAFVRYNNDDYFGAMADYNYAIELKPDNESALFNRALLRYEVRDLKNSAADLTRVIDLDPQNFHAVYNRGLIWMELGENRKAISDFNRIAQRYPRFYPVYYALAEANQNLGNTREAFANYYKAEDLIKAYVNNPGKNPLDKPTIDAGKSNRRGMEAGEDETEIDVMNRFNQLVTVDAAEETHLSYNEKIKGKVQNRSVKVEPEPMYVLSLFDNKNALHTYSNYFRELDDLNSQHYIDETIYLTTGMATVSDASSLENLFSRLENYTVAIAAGKARPVDYMARGVLNTTLKNYQSAVEDFSKALEGTPNSTVSLMGRGVAHWLNSRQKQEGIDDESAMLMKRRDIAAAIADFCEALRYNPRLVYAWFDLGYIYYLCDDYTSAIECFTKAVEIDPTFGEALYNRALSYLQTGNKHQALSDLSKAGERGVMPAYRLLKQMK